MVGFRAAGWTLFAAAVVSITIGLLGLRGIGIVGRKKDMDSSDEATLQNEPEKAEQGDITSAVVIPPTSEES